MSIDNNHQSEYRAVLSARPKHDEHELPTITLIRATLPPDRAGRRTDHRFVLTVEHTDDLEVVHFVLASPNSLDVDVRFEQLEADEDLHAMLAVIISPEHYDEAPLYRLQVVTGQLSDLVEAEYDEEANELAIEVELPHD